MRRNRQQGSLPAKGGLSLCSMPSVGQREGHAFLSHSRQQTDATAERQKCREAVAPSHCQLFQVPSLRHRLVVCLAAVVVLSSPTPWESRRMALSPSLPPSRADVSRACRMAVLGIHALEGARSIGGTRSIGHPVGCYALLAPSQDGAKARSVAMPKNCLGASVKASAKR